VFFGHHPGAGNRVPVGVHDRALDRPDGEPDDDLLAVER
jgi:hypothetical protein